MRGNTPPPAPAKVVATSRFYACIEDVPPDHTGPFTVGHIRDRTDCSLAELAEMGAWDEAEARIDNEDDCTGDEGRWGYGEGL